MNQTVYRSPDPIIVVFLRNLLNLFFTIFEVLLLLRIVLRFFRIAANNEFVSSIYSWTNPLVRPFRGIIGDIKIFDAFTLDMDAIIGWLIYIVIYLIVLECIRFISRLYRATAI